MKPIFYAWIIPAVLAMIVISNPAGARDWWQESSVRDSFDQRTVNLSKPMGPIESAVRVNWVDDYIEVIAGGTVDNRQAVNMAHALSMAQKTARHLAYEKLAETISGISITSDATYDRELMIDANLKTNLSALIRGAQVVEERHEQLADGSIWATVRLGINIVGPGSLMTSTQPWFDNLPRTQLKTRPRVPDPVPAASVPAAKPAPSYTGLIIDAGGLNIRPAMAPRILGQGGEVLYGVHDVDQEYLTKYGMAGYARSVEQARGLERVGANPMIIKAQGITGNTACDIEISSEDAAALIMAGAGSSFLKESRVVIVVN